MVVILSNIIIFLDLTEVPFACLGPELISPDFVYRVYRDHKKPQYFFLNCGERYFLGHGSANNRPKRDQNTKSSIMKPNGISKSPKFIVGS